MDIKSSRPHRAPMEVPKLLLSFYEGKTVAEIGFLAGDFLFPWAEHADLVVGYEDSPMDFVRARRDEELNKLENLMLIQGRVEPENVYVADLYFTFGASSSLPTFELYEKMKEAEKTGMFATFAGIPPKYWENDPAAPQNFYSCFSSQAQLEEWSDEVIYFKSEEVDGRPEFNDLEQKSKLAVVLKKL